MGAKLTWGDALSRIHATHGSTYSFPDIMSEYVNNKSILTGICNTHGAFKCNLNNLTSQKSGCPRCSRFALTKSQTFTPQHVLDMIRSVHGDRYHFPHIASEYKNIRSMLTGWCSTHGEFYSSFQLLVYNRCGCRQCGILSSATTRRSPVSNISDMLHHTHGDRYDYPHLTEEYITTRSKITCVCSIHGEFNTSIGSIIHSKTGCPKCAASRIGDKLRLSLAQLSDPLHEVHGDKCTFPFLSIEYINNRSTLTRLCRTHGYSSVSAGGAMTSGCKWCAAESRADRLRFSIDVVKKRIKDIHGDKYVFPRLAEEYVTSNSVLTAMCQSHGLFKTKLAYISDGNGCPKCGTERGASLIRNIGTMSGLADYSSYCDKVLITDCPTEGILGELMVRCKTCRGLMTPTLSQVTHHVSAINSIGQGEKNFYCSDECRSSCTTFGKKGSNNPPNSEHEARMRKARNCQIGSKSELKKLQRDQYGYNFCDRCGNRTDQLALHHTIEVAKDPDGAITPAGHMLVCEDPCHKELTKRCK